MIDFLTYIYPSSFVSKTNFFAKSRTYSLVRFIIRKLSNIFLPVIFMIENKFIERRLGDCAKTRKNVIVSLTSFPARIKNVHLVIESILRQSVLPERIVLWLSKKQFYSLDNLPKNLRQLINRGLEIRLCEGEDIRSYKKFYYTVKEYPDTDFIIIDDDTFYPSNFIKNLLSYQQKYPNMVIFNRGYQVIIQNQRIQAYNEWRLLEKESGPANDILPTGVGGVLYPAGILPEEVLQKDIFMKYCQYADDIWLYSMVLYGGGKLVKTKDFRHFIPVLNKNNKTLSSINQCENMNDVQLSQLYGYYRDTKGIDLYGKIKRDIYKKVL